MSKHLGFGVMINMLSSRDGALKAITHAKGKKIKGAEIKEDNLRFLLEDGSTLILWDNGQSCCESRYMNTDDDLQSVVGGKLKDILIQDGPTEESEYGDPTEVQFLKIQTSKGEITVANYNSHNGYYGGFSLDARLEKAK